MTAVLFLLLIFGAIAAGVVLVARRTSASRTASPAGTARRVVVFALLFGLVTVTAIGISGLLSRIIGGSDLAGDDVTGLARSLAFTLIAGPIGAVLWWYLWKGIDDEAERSSLGWSLYAAGMSTVSLIVATTALLSTANAAVDSEWQAGTFSIGLVWALVWVWHRWMRFHPAKGPTRLDDLATIVGSYWGLGVMAGGSVAALTSLFEEASDALFETPRFGDPWWVFTVQSAIWAVGGAAVWLWHWVKDSGSELDTGFADTALVLGGTTGTGLLALGGIGGTVFTLLSLILDRQEELAVTVEPLPAALAAVVVGGTTWAYHRSVLRHRTPGVKEAARLLASGIGLAVAATGVGIVVNSVLDALTVDLAGEGAGRALLVGGLTTLVVGGPLWWVAWQPTQQHQGTVTSGRRIYLVAVFGLSALVAVITLLFIGYRVFEFMLDDISGGSLVDRVRVPLGLLAATGLVAGYHFPVWKRDRERAEVAPHGKKIDHVILVTGSNPEPLRHVIDQQTGAAVTVWMRSDVNGDGPTPEHLAEAMADVEGKRVMVVTGPGSRVEVIPLQK